MPLESRHKQAQNEICTLQAEGYPSRCTAEAAPYTVACGPRPAARGMQRGSRHDRHTWRIRAKVMLMLLAEDLKLLSLQRYYPAQTMPQPGRSPLQSRPHQ